VDRHYRQPVDGFELDIQFSLSPMTGIGAFRPFPSAASNVA
jgi:hypothetical protein